ncbi:MAG: hypothetical protein ACPGLV_04545 [Bacteroidia bacterium]
MKRFILTTLVLTYTICANSQSPKDQEINFKYIQYPLLNQGPNVKTYSSKVYLKYVEDIRQQQANEKAEFDRLVAADKMAYDQRLAEYPGILAEYEARYAAEMKEYDKLKKEYDDKSAGLKIVEKQILEKDTEPRKPYYNPPRKPVMPTRYFRESEHQKIFDEQELANTYLNLEGFTEDKNTGLKIEVTLFGYESLEPQLKVDKKKETIKQKSGRTATVTKYYYSIEHKYRHPMNVKVVDLNGNILVNEVLAATSEYTTYKTNPSQTRPAFNKVALMQHAENKIVTDNLLLIQDYLNNNFGYPIKERRTDIYFVKDRKGVYTDYQKAFEIIYAAYNQYFDEPIAAKQKIAEAIEIWGHQCCVGWRKFKNQKTVL